MKSHDATDYEKGVPHGQASTTADVFGQTFDCECGKTHSIMPREVLYERAVAGRLAEVCARILDGRRAAVLMDERTRVVAGDEVCRSLNAAGWTVEEVQVPDPADGRSPVCDELTKEDLAREIAPSDLFLAVGSGVLNDLAKWLAYDRGVPFACLATAASMNGYASANIAPTVKGVKTLVRARPAEFVAADPDVIEGAPWEMTASGLGDILAKSVSSADWHMNHLLFGDYYCTRSVGLIAAIEPLYMDHPEALKNRASGATAALFRGLLLTGVAMTMAETSAPSSGGEHMVSHALDMMSAVDGRPHDLHGRQVGVGTLLASELYRRVMNVESPDFHVPEEGVDRLFWGPLAGAVADAYAEKRVRLEGAVAALRQDGMWDRLREALSPMLRTPERLRNCLARAGGACRSEDIGCDSARLLAAFRHAHEIRSRFTVLDLAWLVGVMPGAAAEIVDVWG